MEPIAGMQVVLNTLLKDGDFEGCILTVDSEYLGKPLVSVKLNCQEKPVRSVVFYAEEPDVVEGSLWQICYPKK